jgi:uncharacterized protein (TIGR03083 family)
MTSLADRAIAGLRDEHDTLAALVQPLSDDQLARPSGATEWTLAQVLSHLGSGAEIMLVTLQAGLGERDAPDENFNPSVWDRWNALSAAEQRDGFLQHNAALVAAYEAFDSEQRETVRISVGYLPDPLPLADFAGLRLNEAALHGWDARVALDPAAELLSASAQVLAELFSGGLGFLLQFTGKADQVSDRVLLDIAASGYGISVTDSVALVSQVDQPTATFSGPLGAALRLIAGRLRAEYTPNDVAVTGNITLDELRAVFPGY